MPRLCMESIGDLYIPIDMVCQNYFSVGSIFQIFIKNSQNRKTASERGLFHEPQFL